MKQVLHLGVALIFLLLASSSGFAQNLGMGILISPQHSMFAYSNTYAPKQNIGVGLATGVTVEWRVNSSYATELQALYSFEKHELRTSDTLKFSGTNNYVKFALMNNFVSFGNTSLLRLITGIGPQVGVLTQANARNIATDIVADYMDTTTKYDIGLATQMGIQLGFSDATIRAGLRYDMGFIDTTPKSTKEKIKNNTIGVFFTIQANL